LTEYVERKTGRDVRLEEASKNEIGEEDRKDVG
jgi:hypothetical protein